MNEVLNNLKYDEIMQLNRRLGEQPSKGVYRISVLSNIMGPQLKDILEYNLRSQAIAARVEFGNYDNIVQECEKFSSSSLVIVFWELANLIDGLHYKINGMPKPEMEGLLAKTKGEIDFVLSKLGNNSLVLFNKFSTLAFTNDCGQEDDQFAYLCNALNAHLRQVKPTNVMVIDIDQVMAQVSVKRSVDFRFYYSSKALYTIDFFKEYVSFINPIILSANGRAKKALILDCDNTLWRGILGEDGFEGIDMNPQTPKGAVFQEVQTLVNAMAGRGVLIGLCSRNDGADVDKVLKSHPDIILNDSLLAVKKVNWNDKVTNLEQIAKDLNIGLDSIVFLDDSAFEVNLIKETLPDVTAVMVPKKLSDYPETMRKISRFFYNLSQTKEDLSKAAMFHREEQRRAVQKTFKNVTDYLKSIGLEIEIQINDPSIIARLAQLTQKTNQFNLTTKRYTEKDIENFMASKKSRVFSFGLKDKFGDYGIVGLAIVIVEGEEGIVDTFLMSCRAIGRDAEYAFFDYIIRALKKIGCEKLKAQYIRKLKNEQVSGFYDRLGANLLNEADGIKTYALPIKKYKNKSPQHIKIMIKKK